MKKTLFSLLFVLIGFVAQVNAQIYTEPVQRVKGELHLNNSGAAIYSGMLYMSTVIDEVKVSTRSKQIYKRSLTTDKGGNSTKDFFYDYKDGDVEVTNGSNWGPLAISYKDLTPECDTVYALAGQDITIEVKVGEKSGFANAVLYIDWDGNGSFDDHEPDLYNLYNLTSSAKMEHNSVGVDTWGGTPVRPVWTVTIPKTFNTQQSVRMRVRASEAVDQTVSKRGTVIGAVNDIVGATDAGTGGLNSKQYFYTNGLFAFMPSGTLSNGQTVDIVVNVLPYTYSPMQTVSSTPYLYNEVGGATACGFNKGVAMDPNSKTEYIKDGQGLVDWIKSADRKPNAVLGANVEIAAQAFTEEFDGGTLDGNGFTISIKAGTPSIGNSQTDECFFPFGLSASTLSANMLNYDYNENKPVVTNEYPSYNIAGCLFGKLGTAATVKNLKIKIDADATYTGNNNMIFGVVAGITRGRIENVKVEFGAKVTVQSTKFDRPWAVGGLTGILYRGVVKNCEVDLNDKTLSVAPSSFANSLCGETCLGGFIGRLQGGIVSNIKFSGESGAYLEMKSNAALTHTRYYIGGVAGMTNTPKGVFCKNQEERQLYWGYDNGSTGLDVNNVILNYQGHMLMTNRANASNANHTYYCRGLLFGEATDTITVPVVVAQGASSFTIEEEANVGYDLAGSNIPFTSRTYHTGPNESQKNGNLRDVGRLFLYRDGRIPKNKAANTFNKYTVVTAPNTELNWGYMSEQVTKSDGTGTLETSCVTFYQPYIIATYTGKELIKSIENASSNVTFGGDELGGTPYAKLDPDPASVTTATWTWSTASPPSPPLEVDQAVCGSGSGTTVTPTVRNTNLSCTVDGTDALNGTSERWTTSVTVSGTNSNSVTISGLQSSKTSKVYFPNNASTNSYSNITTLTVKQGETITASFNGTGLGQWIHGYAFVDYDNDGTFNRNYNSTDTYLTDFPTYKTPTNTTADVANELVSFSFLSPSSTTTKGFSSANETFDNRNRALSSLPTFKIPENLNPGTYTMRLKVDWNSTNPCGNQGGTDDYNNSSDNYIQRIGGIIVDLELNVEGDANTAVGSAPTVRVTTLPCTGGGGYIVNNHSNRHTTGVGMTSADGFTNYTDNGCQTHSGGNNSGAELHWKKTPDSDIAAPAIEVKQGAELTPTINLLNPDNQAKPNMHKYVYIDYDNSGEYNTTNELVAYNYYDGKNSKGQTTNSDGSDEIPPFTIPADLNPGTYYIRFKVDWDNIDPCGTSSIKTNSGILADYELKVVAADGGGTTPSVSYTDPGNEDGGKNASIYVSDITVNKNGVSEKLYGTTSRVETYKMLDKGITVQPGDEFTLTLKAVNSNESHLAIFADWNCDGVFSGEWKSPYTAGTSAATITADGTTDEYIRIVGTHWKENDGLLNEYTQTFRVPANATSGNACIRVKYTDAWHTGTTSVFADDATTPTRKGVTYDIPLAISGGAGNGCYYEYDFGEVWVGEESDHTFKINVTPADEPVAEGGNNPYTCTYVAGENGNGELQVKFKPTQAGDYNIDGAITFKVGDEDYQVNLKGKAKATPHVEFRIADNGGGQLSRDFGSTLIGTSKVFETYKGEIVTAVPVGPTKLVKWEKSIDEGATWDSIASIHPSGMISPDWQYQGDVKAILRATFDFKEYEGDFGLAKFTDATKKPFFIKSINTTGALININADNIFTSINEGVTKYAQKWDDTQQKNVDDLTKPIEWDDSERYKMLENQGLQTKPVGLGEQEVEVTVTMEHMENFNSDVRLMCFVDYNGNGYFDFASSDDATAKKLVEDNELVFVGRRHANGFSGKDAETQSEYSYSESGTNNKIGTFTFKLSNEGITKYVYGRIRFIAATYVDAYGLGPVNQYGNYQPRVVEDHKVVEEIPLNDNNGARYEPSNQCHIESYVNAVDAIFDVVLYLKAKDDMGTEDTKVIGKSEMTRMGYIYIESVEDEFGEGIHSGKILFDKDDPHGSIQLNGSILVKKRIYKNRWHQIAFPFDVYGNDGYVTPQNDHRIKVYTKNGEIVPIDPDAWLLKTYDSTQRNEPNGHNKGNEDADKGILKANTFYYFAADNIPEEATTYETDQEAAYYWVLFHSTKRGWNLQGTEAAPVQIKFTADTQDKDGNEIDQYWNKNVFTFYNPYLSPVNVQDVTTSVGWENITWWNAAKQKYEGVSASQNRLMPPFYGYWVQFTENHPHGSEIVLTFGDQSKTHNDPDEHNHITLGSKAMAAPQATFDTPDAYTIGIDRVADKDNANAVSTTIVTLTDAGSVDEMRAGYDMAVSYAKNSQIPEIWSRAGASRMMFNDVRREDEVTVPLGIRIKEAGEYVVRLTHTNCNDALVQLRDLQTGAIVELQRDGENYMYAFLADKGDSERFELVIGSPKMVTDLDIAEMTDEVTDMLIYKSGDVLRLQHVPVGYSIEVCDVVGREVLNATVTDDDMQVCLPDAQGVYLVRVRNAQGVQQQVIKLTR